MTKKVVLPIVAGAAMLGFAGAAAASPAYMNSTVNVRNGPGIYYQIVSKAYRGQDVDVRGCQRGWCYIEKRGRDGWVAARFLDSVDEGPSVDFYLDFGWWPGFRPHPPGPPGPGPGGPGPFGPGGGGGPPGPPGLPFP